MEPQTPSKTLRILIAEDHELARNGLIACLANISDLRIAGDARNGQEAVRFLEQSAVEVVLMDIRMPVLDGIEATRKIKADFPDTKVIMLTSHQEAEEVFAALAAGADAYCMKDIPVERLAEVIRMVHDGAIWLDPAIARMVMSMLPLSVNAKPRTTQTRTRYNTELSDWEREVLEKIAQGKSNRQIAEELCITLHTVKAHVNNILQKLAVDDRTTAAITAIQHGIISSQPNSPSL